MQRWLRRIRGAVGMGLAWAIGWGLVGLLIGVTSFLVPAVTENSFFSVFDAPLPAMAVPGFFAGAFFSIVLGIAGRGRRLSELALPRVALWGAVGGALLTLFPAALVAVGLGSTEGSDVSLWRALGIVSGPFVILSALSATVILLLARLADKREQPEPSRT